MLVLPSKYSTESIATQTIDAENDFRPNLWVCVTIDAMLSFAGDVDIDANADVQCEQSITSLPLSYA